MSAPAIPQQSSWTGVPASYGSGLSDKRHDEGERHFVVSIIGPDVAALPLVSWRRRYVVVSLVTRRM